MSRVRSHIFSRRWVTSKRSFSLYLHARPLKSLLPPRPPIESNKQASPSKDDLDQSRKIIAAMLGAERGGGGAEVGVARYRVSGICLSSNFIYHLWIVQIFDANDPSQKYVWSRRVLLLMLFARRPACMRVEEKPKAERSFINHVFTSPRCRRKRMSKCAVRGRKVEILTPQKNLVSLNLSRRSCVI